MVDASDSVTWKHVAYWCVSEQQLQCCWCLFCPGSLRFLLLLKVPQWVVLARLCVWPVCVCIPLALFLSPMGCLWRNVQRTFWFCLVSSSLALGPLFSARAQSRLETFHELSSKIFWCVDWHVARDCCLLLRRAIIVWGMCFPCLANELQMNWQTENQLQMPMIDNSGYSCLVIQDSLLLSSKADGSLRLL